MSDESAMKEGCIWEETETIYEFVSCKLIDNAVQPTPPQKEIINNNTRTSVIVKKVCFDGDINMKQFLKFLTKIKSFWKFYQNYEYDGETVEFIVDNYQEVLCNRTKLMSKPTYYANDVIEQIDNWYEEVKGIKNYGFERQGIRDNAEYE